MVKNVGKWAFTIVLVAHFAIGCSNSEKPTAEMIRDSQQDELKKSREPITKVVSTPSDQPEAKWPEQIRPGENLDLRGKALGTNGKLTIDGLNAEVLDWTDGHIVAIVPHGLASETAKMRLELANGESLTHKVSVLHELPRSYESCLGLDDRSYQQVLQTKTSPESSIEALCLRALATFELKDPVNAESDLKKAKAHLGKTTEGRSAAFYYGVLAFTLRASNPDKAAELFQTANEAEPDSPTSNPLPYLLQIKWLAELASQPGNEESVQGAKNLIAFLKENRNLSPAESASLDHLETLISKQASAAPSVEQ